MLEITSVSTECRTRLDILIEVVLLLARRTHNVLKVFKPETDSFTKTFLTASKHNFFFKLVVKRRGIQEFVTCTCIVIAASKRFQLQIRFSTAPGNNLKRLQYDLIRSLSRLPVESLLHESPKQLRSSTDSILATGPQLTRGGKKWQNQNHRPRFERNFRKKTKKRWRRG